MIGFEEKLIGQQMDCIVLIESRDEKDESCYLFLKVRADRLPYLRHAMGQDYFTPSQFGEILRMNTGKPDEKVLADAQAQFGFNAQLMTALPITE